MADEGIQLDGPLANLLEKLPTTGGVDDNTPPLTGADQKAAAEKAEKEAKAKAEAEAARGTQSDNTLTEEQIQSKLDELAAKEETQLTDDEKKFIKQYTDEQLDEISTTKQHLETKFNVKLEGTFDNSPEGLITLAEAASKARAEQKVLGYFESIPLMKEFYQHIVVEKKGIDTFLEKNKQPEFKSIKIEQIADSNDEAKNTAILNNQKQIIKMDLSSKGMNQDDIDNLISLYEDKGTLYDKAKEAFNGLDKRHKESVDVKLKSEEARIKQEQKELQDTIAKVNTIIDSNDFGGVSIPMDDVKGFKDAILKPVDDDGNTILDYKRSKLTIQQRLLLDYMVWKDLKNVGLSPVKNLNKKFTFKKASEDNNDRGGGRTRGASDNNIDSQIKLPNFDFTKIKVEHQTI